MTPAGAAAESLRVVVLCGDGPYQRHLVKRLRARYEVTGVVVRRETRPKGTLPARLGRYANPVRLARYSVARWHMSRAAAAARPLEDRLFGPSGSADDSMEGIEHLVVENINDPQATAFLTHHAPDIVCVNGTNLLRQPMLAVGARLPFGIINLHTGLSPYTRGGNCNLHALLEGRPEWVGVTVHHIDPGIDSGDLILTAQVPMEADDNYDMIDARAFHLGIDSMIVAVRQLVESRAARVAQWQADGRLYLRRTGFVYEPYLRYRVDRRIKQGLLSDYLANKPARDATVRLVGAAH